LEDSCDEGEVGVFEEPEMESSCATGAFDFDASEGSEIHLFCYAALMHDPVITNFNGTILFEGSKVGIQLFRDIREYVDGCLAPKNRSERWASRWTEDIDLLEALVGELDKSIPWFTTEEEDEAITAIPPQPRRPIEVVRPPRYIDGELSDDSAEWIAHFECERQFKRWQSAVFFPWYENLPGEGANEEEIQKYWQAKPPQPSEQGRLSSARLERRKMIKTYLRECEKANELQGLFEAYHRDLPEMRRRYDVHLRIEGLRREFGRKKEIVNRMLRELRAAREMGGIFFETVPWVILASGEGMFERVNLWFDDLRKRRPESRWEKSRLDHLLRLRPIRVIKGKEDFDGYLAFMFEKVPFTVLECPKVGNAIYLLKGDWIGLSKLSKGELLDRRQAERIVHDPSDRWKSILHAKFQNGKLDNV